MWTEDGNSFFIASSRPGSRALVYRPPRCAPSDGGRTNTQRAGHEAACHGRKNESSNRESRFVLNGKKPAELPSERSNSRTNPWLLCRPATMRRGRGEDRPENGQAQSLAPEVEVLELLPEFRDGQGNQISIGKSRAGHQLPPADGDACGRCELPGWRGRATRGSSIVAICMEPLGRHELPLNLQLGSDARGTC